MLHVFIFLNGMKPVPLSSIKNYGLRKGRREIIILFFLGGYPPFLVLKNAQYQYTYNKKKKSAQQNHLIQILSNSSFKSKSRELLVCVKEAEE